MSVYLAGGRALRRLLMCGIFGRDEGRRTNVAVRHADVAAGGGVH